MMHGPINIKYLRNLAGTDYEHSKDYVITSKHVGAM
jgi:hypothetical protein